MIRVLEAERDQDELRCALDRKSGQVLADPAGQVRRAPVLVLAVEVAEQTLCRVNLSQRVEILTPPLRHRGRAVAEATLRVPGSRHRNPRATREHGDDDCSRTALQEVCAAQDGIVQVR
jgi:hypothetical protein